MPVAPGSGSSIDGITGSSPPRYERLPSVGDLMPGSREDGPAAGAAAAVAAAEGEEHDQDDSSVTDGPGSTTYGDERTALLGGGAGGASGGSNSAFSSAVAAFAAAGGGARGRARTPNSLTPPHPHQHPHPHPHPHGPGHGHHPHGQHARSHAPAPHARGLGTGPVASLLAAAAAAAAANANAPHHHHHAHKRHSVSGGADSAGGGMAGDLEAGPRVRRFSSASSPQSRWQATAKRVMHGIHTMHAIDEAMERHEPGAAPGIDPRRAKYAHLAAKWCLPVRVTVVDYDSKEVTITPDLLSADDLSAFLAANPNTRPRPGGGGGGGGAGAGGGGAAVSGAAAAAAALAGGGGGLNGSATGRVRWIHVDGLNWEVIQLLALTYDLHPLALEDTVHVPQRIKGDFYDSCLYISLIYLYLAAGAADAPEAAAAAATRAASAAAPEPHTPSATPNAARRMARTISGVRRADAAAAAAALAATASETDRSVGGGGGGGGRAASVTSSSYNTILNALSGFASGSSITAGNGRKASLPGPSHYPLPLRRGSVVVSSGADFHAVGEEDEAGGGDGSPTDEAAEAEAEAAAVVRPRLPPGGAKSPGGNRPSFSIATRVANGGGSGGGGGGRGGGGGGVHSEHHGGRDIHVSAQQVSLFLLRGEHANTLITIFQSDGSDVTRPILAQLREPRTLVREAEDASFLANLVIDTLVDHIFPVVGAYTEQLQQYEAAVMAPGGQLPSAASTRELHAMQRDLRRIDRTIAPMQAVVANIIARDAAAEESAAARRQQLQACGLEPAEAAAGAGGGVAPFLSRLTRIYMGDVKDHVSTICEDLMSLSAECGDLIGLIFNLTTHQQSQYAQTLAVVSTIFLPITFLAGVYGMNFDTLPELHWQYGYAYFWVTSVIIVVVFICVMLRAGLWSV
ncbi:hypothetical protein HXX76_011684 [Chlamydomonas incerta]|uniref:Uncharacterized protein n=1 Tax=Chlamydomonas incerta TaxID=51695 RepID=A0A835SMX7_CHLIN|nr:hypothetical protein HXX76_011684 [Chlamydomonas incerta]|eukprot:KAG2426453.1 hypothetical protein HXX76_011684 [Chlamydomonas incerta]